MRCAHRTDPALSSRGALALGRLTAADLIAWRARYDRAEALVGEVHGDRADWRLSLGSDQPRAVVTTQVVFAGQIEATAQLREPQFAEFQTGGLRLPVWARRAVLSLTWMTGYRSQRACRGEFQRRVMAVADRLGAGNVDTLIVSQAGMMASLNAELRRRGFTGPKLRIARHATVYTYRRNDAQHRTSELGNRQEWFAE